MIEIHNRHRRQWFAGPIANDQCITEERVNHDIACDYDVAYGEIHGAKLCTLAPGLAHSARMKLGVVRETKPEERRVAASPNVVGKWVKAGWQVEVEKDAGTAATFPDEQYTAAGASIVDRATAWSADLVLKVRPPDEAEVDQLREGGCLISFLYPAQNDALLAKLQARKVTALA